jgi:endonuclease/exonuclease/phosphatase family metal-dependent hydrolase
MATILAVGALLVQCPTYASASDHEVRIASWNIRNLSRNSRSDAELGIISLVLFRYDVIAIQEVRTDDQAITRIQEILEDDFEAEYGIDVSGPVGTNNRKERYAFVWRTDLVTQTEAGAFFNDAGDQFDFEPYCASFRAGSFDWTMCAVHIKFGDSEEERRPEIQTLDDVYRSVKSASSERDIIICGDFNFPPDDEGWTELKAEDGMRFAISPPAKTTVAVNSSLYDNCWWPNSTSEVIVDSGSVFEFENAMYPLGTFKEAKRLTSDHRPISIRARVDQPDDD